MDRPRQITAIALLAAVVALVAAGCSTDKQVALPSLSPGALSVGPDTPYPSTPSSPGGVDGVPPSPPDTPMASPGSPVVGHPTGASESHVHGPGVDVSLHFTSVDPYAFYSGPNGQASLTFADANQNTLSIGGFIHKGTEKTSQNLGLSLTLLGQSIGSPLTLSSGDGTCRVTFTTATKSAVAGKFVCAKLPATKKVKLSASGTFSGTFANGG